MEIIKVLKNVKENTEYCGEDVIADMYYQFRVIDLDKPIVISFPTATREEIFDPKTPIPSFDFLSKYDVNVLSFGVIGKMDDNYFTNPDFSSFIECLGKLLGQFKLRLGFSNSKGGFGIGTYAEALRLDSVLLFFPVSTKQEDLVPWDSRKSTVDANQITWSPPYNKVNLGRCKGYVVYDPTDKIDAKHASNFKGLVHIKINGLVHGAGYSFLVHNSDLIQNMAYDFFKRQELDIKTIREKSKVLRLSKKYFERLVNKKPQNKTLLANQKRLINILDSPLNAQKNTITNKEINLIRNSAIALEGKDMTKSLYLMELAHKLRPEGKFIIKKISDYKRKLNK